MQIGYSPMQNAKLLLMWYLYSDTINNLYAFLLLLF